MSRPPLALPRVLGLAEVTAGASLLTGLSYAELASMFPSAAAEYEYTRRAFPEWAAFVVGWIMIAGLVVATGAVALGFARYLGQFVDVPARLGALALLAAVAAVAVAGIKASARLTLGLSTIQVGGLRLVIVSGAPHVGEVNLLDSRGAMAVLGAASLVFFAFLGFDEVITLAEETRTPSVTVPRALLLALGISTALYIRGAGRPCASSAPP